MLIILISISVSAFIIAAYIDIKNLLMTREQRRRDSRINFIEGKETEVSKLRKMFF
jgi:hypothetical protein